LLLLDTMFRQPIISLDCKRIGVIDRVNERLLLLSRKPTPSLLPFTSWMI